MRRICAAPTIIAGALRGPMVTEQEQPEIVHWLAELKTEHRDLDEVVGYLMRTGYPDSMMVQRLKKRKLKLKDMIAKLESRLIPDLDA